MKKFTKILENQHSEKLFEVSAELKLIVKAENEGEAGYLADSILGGLKDQKYYTILDIKSNSDLNTDSKS